MRLPSPRRRTALLCTLALGVGLGACADALVTPDDTGTGGGNPRSEYEATATAATIEALSHAIVESSMETSFEWALTEGAWVSLPYNALLVIWAKTGEAGPPYYYPIDLCTSVTMRGTAGNGRPIDADADGFPDDLMVEFGTECRYSTADGHFTMALSGSVHRKDLQIPGAGHSIELHDLKLTYTDLTTGRVYIESTEAFEAYTVVGGIRSHQLDLQEAGAEYGGTGPANDWGRTTIERSTLTPDPGAILNTLGGPVAGVVDFDGDYSFIDWIDELGRRRSHRFVVHTPTPLHYGDQCGYPAWNGGELVGLLNGNPDIGFRRTWAQCADDHIEIFGNTESNTR